MKNLKIVISLAMVVVAMTSVSQVKALNFKEAKVTLGDTRSGQTGVSYDFSFKHTSANTIKKLTFDFCKVPSGAGDNCGTPVASGSIAGAVLGSVSATLGVVADWSTSKAGSIISIEHTTGTVGLTADAVVTVGFTTIQNSTLGEQCDQTAGTDTCFIWIKSYLTNGTSILDTGVVTYTIVDAVTVSAKVDPTFTFVVSPVLLNTVNNEITTSVTSLSNTLPFGSLSAGTPKYAAHALAVTTNTQGGYSVSTAMVSQMIGVYTDNNIDPFMAAWTAPTTWTEPTGGTPNTNTGWIGANTTDTDIAQWAGGQTPQQKFGAISGSAVVVSTKNSSDNGTVPVIVTYGIEANVFQPSDAYSGILTYNALPTY